MRTLASEPRARSVCGQRSNSAVEAAGRCDTRSQASSRDLSIVCWTLSSRHAACCQPAACAAMRRVHGARTKLTLVNASKCAQATFIKVHKSHQGCMRNAALLGLNHHSCGQSQPPFLGDFPAMVSCWMVCRPWHCKDELLSSKRNCSKGCKATLQVSGSS
jgi:hypothetical protein